MGRGSNNVAKFGPKDPIITTTLGTGAPCFRFWSYKLMYQSRRGWGIRLFYESVQELFLTGRKRVVLHERQSVPKGSAHIAAFAKYADLAFVAMNDLLGDVETQTQSLLH